MSTATQTGSAALPPAALNGSGSLHVHNALPADVPASFPAAGAPVPPFDVEVETAPYRVDAFVIRAGTVRTRVAYAVVDCWGWAVVARIPEPRGRLVLTTVGRVDFERWPARAARAEVARRVAGMAATWAPPNKRDAALPGPNAESSAGLSPAPAPG